jgi:hypothetical protein
VTFTVTGGRRDRLSSTGVLHRNDAGSLAHREPPHRSAGRRHAGRIDHRNPAGHDPPTHAAGGAARTTPAPSSGVRRSTAPDTRPEQRKGAGIAGALPRSLRHGLLALDDDPT